MPFSTHCFPCTSELCQRNRLCDLHFTVRDAEFGDANGLAQDRTTVNGATLPPTWASWCPQPEVWADTPVEMVGEKQQQPRRVTDSVCPGKNNCAQGNEFGQRRTTSLSVQLSVFTMHISEGYLPNLARNSQHWPVSSLIASFGAFGASFTGLL